MPPVPQQQSQIPPVPVPSPQVWPKILAILALVFLGLAAAGYWYFKNISVAPVLTENPQSEQMLENQGSQMPASLVKIPPSVGATVLAEDRLCGGSLSIRLQKIPRGLGGTEYPVDVYYIANGNAKSVVHFDETLLYYQYAMLKMEGRSYWPVDRAVDAVVIEKPNEQIDGVPFINIFVDPANFSIEEFNTIAQCMKSEAEKFTALLQKTPNPYPGGRAVALSQMRLGGLTYSSFVNYTQNTSKTSSSLPVKPFFVTPNQGPLSLRHSIHPEKQDWIIITADGPDQSVDLTGWYVRSTQSGNDYVIAPFGEELRQIVIGSSDTAAIIHTVGPTSKTYRAEGEWHIYLGFSSVGWGKEHDTIQLVDPLGAVVDTYSY